MRNVKVRLRPVAGNINLPTVIKTAFLPGDPRERLFIATQTGQIYYIGNEGLTLFLDIGPRIIKLGENTGGYDERGLLGLAFHPQFFYNGLFYLHYSEAGTQGPGALPGGYSPDPCNPETLHLKWNNREERYDHIDTVEEWILETNGRPRKRRTLLKLRRPFMNHNGYNSLTFSPESGRLVLTTGDGGSGFDPFNLSQDDMEIAGKIIEIDVNQPIGITDLPAATRFDELPAPVQNMLSVIAKGVRNMSSPSYQPMQNYFIKYAGQTGQDFVESIYSFIHYRPVPVPLLVQASRMKRQSAAGNGINNINTGNGIINFGWRGWEGDFPTPVMKPCPTGTGGRQKAISFYKEAAALSAERLRPLTSYFHEDPRPGKFSGTALTGVQAYLGTNIPALTGAVVFTDFARKETAPRIRGALAYTYVRQDGRQNDFYLLEVNHDFGAQPAHFVSLGANLAQTRLFLGVNGSGNVTDFHKGTVFEIVPDR